MIDRLGRGVVAALAAVSALAAPPAVAARSPSCISRAQLGTLTHVLFPVVVDQALTRCGALLPSDAYLVRAAAKLRASFPAVKASDPGAIRRALEAFVGETLPAAVDDATVARMLTGMAGEKFGLAKLSLAQCRDASDIVEPLDPLPPAEFERLIVAVFAVAGRKNRDITVCEAPNAAQR